MGKYLVLITFLIFCQLGLVSADSADDTGYVGSKTCSGCHEKQYATFKESSRKAHSWDSVAIMADKLKDQEIKLCFQCHTTGYGKKGGFVSKETTPDLAEVGCEACHGPGKQHAESGNPTSIKRPENETCSTCHNAQRSEDFGFKPLACAGAH